MRSIRAATSPGRASSTSRAGRSTSRSSRGRFKPELARLATQLRRPACLHVADGADVFVIDFEDPDAAETCTIRVWPRERVDATAAGLTITALLPASKRNAAHSDETERGLAQAPGARLRRPP